MENEFSKGYAEAIKDVKNFFANHKLVTNRRLFLTALLYNLNENYDFHRRVENSIRELGRKTKVKNA